MPPRSQLLFSNFPPGRAATWMLSDARSNIPVQLLACAQELSAIKDLPKQAHIIVATVTNLVTIHNVTFFLFFFTLFMLRDV